jgi:hypothetical protein
MPDEIKLPTNLSVVNPDGTFAVADSQLDELEQMAVAAAQPLSEKIDSVSDDELTTLEGLAEVIKGVADERTRRTEATAAETVRDERKAKAAAAFAGKTSTTKTDPTGPDGGEPTEDEPGDGKPQTKKVGVAAVAASAGKQTDTTDVQVERNHYATMVAAADSPGISKSAGQKFDNWAEVGEALNESLDVLRGMGEAGVTASARRPVVQFRRSYPDEVRLFGNETPEQTYQKLEYAAKQSRLPGQALTAAAGWCAPSQILYDLYEIENGTDGMYDTPELQASRGGFQYTAGPDFSAIWGGSSTSPAWPQGFWHQTETQVQAGRTKPTMVVPCPSFTNTRLEVEGVQITGAFLQDRGYPELVARFSRGAMVVHNRRLNAFKLNVVTDGSTLIDLTGANWPATVVESKDLTVVSRMLAGFGIQAMDYRYRYRMGLTDQLEVVLPYWIVEPVRADIQRRTLMNPDDAFSVAVNSLTSWFATRNMRLQLVYDWQDSFNVPTSVTQWSNTTDGTARFTVNTSTNVGNPASQIYSLPTTAYGLIYAPGTWVALVSDIIRLDTVYDAANLALNSYVQLFTEEGIAMAKRGYESRLLKFTLEPSGTTSATTSMTV